MQKLSSYQRCVPLEFLHIMGVCLSVALLPGDKNGDILIICYWYILYIDCYVWHLFKETLILYMKTNTHLWQYLAQFFLDWEKCHTKVVEKIKTHILCSVTFCAKLCRLWDNVEKYCRCGQATDDNMAHAHFMLVTWVC